MTSRLRILVVNGPNLGRLGERQPEIYGTKGMESLVDLLDAAHPALAANVELEFFQSNSEGAIIDELERARDRGVDGIALNAGALTHTSLALADCLAWIGIPAVEVHLSNILAREDYRHKSMIAAQCVGVVSGFGLTSYVLAVQALFMRLRSV